MPQLELDEAARRDRHRGADGLIDDQLALLLGCCHPALADDAQVALSLRAVAGLSVAQIAHAFGVTPSTMERRLTRAKSKIRTAGIPFRVPDREGLVERLVPVRHVVASIFTEGHTRSDGDTLVHGDLCDEAAWLAELLVELVPRDAEVRGLAALIALSDARRPTRFAPDGELVLLEDQDRAAWDRSSIDRGLVHLRVAHEQMQLGPFQIEAAIAALHVTAASFDATDWVQIVRLYDLLAVHAPSPVVELNRAVAVAYRDGPQAGLDLLDPLADLLDGSSYLHASRAELLVRLGRVDEARIEFRAARDRCANEVERRHLSARLAAIG